MGHNTQHIQIESGKINIDTMISELFKDKKVTILKNHSKIKKNMSFYEFEHISIRVTKTTKSNIIWLGKFESDSNNLYKENKYGKILSSLLKTPKLKILLIEHLDYSNNYGYIYFENGKIKRQDYYDEETSEIRIAELKKEEQNLLRKLTDKENDDLREKNHDKIFSDYLKIDKVVVDLGRNVFNFSTMDDDEDNEKIIEDYIVLVEDKLLAKIIKKIKWNISLLISTISNEINIFLSIINILTINLLFIYFPEKSILLIIPLIIYSIFYIKKSNDDYISTIFYLFTNIFLIFIISVIIYIAYNLIII